MCERGREVVLGRVREGERGSVRGRKCGSEGGREREGGSEGGRGRVRMWEGWREGVKRALSYMSASRT